MRNRFSMVLACVAVLACTAGPVAWSWASFVHQRTEKERTRLNTAADLLQHQIESELMQRFAVIRAMAAVIGRQNAGKSSELFDTIAPPIRLTHKVLGGLLLSDIGGKVVRCDPAGLNDYWLNRNLLAGSEAQMQETAKYIQRGTPIMGAVHHASDGSLIILLHQPVVRDGRSVAVISAIYRVDPLLDGIIDQPTRDAFRISISDPKRVIYDRPAGASEEMEHGTGAMTRKVAVSRTGRWTLRLQPSNPPQLAALDHLPFALGLLFSAALSLALPLTMRATLSARAAAANLQREVDHRTTLLNELNHRVRNNLAAVIGMLQQARSSGDPAHQQPIDDTIHRLIALGHVQGMLSSSGWKDLPLASLLESISRLAAQRSKATLEVKLDPAAQAAFISPARANAFALGVHELADLALRGSSSAALRVSASVAGDELRICFGDDSNKSAGGIPHTWPPLAGLIKQELDGRLWADTTGGHGLLCLSMRLSTQSDHATVRTLVRN